MHSASPFWSWASARRENIRVRQPLSRILLSRAQPFVQRSGGDSRVSSHPSSTSRRSNTSSITGCDPQKAKPNFKTLGRNQVKTWKPFMTLSPPLDQKQIADIERSGSYTLVIGDNNYDLVLEDFEITSEDIPGWTVASDKGITVAPDVAKYQQRTPTRRRSPRARQPHPKHPQGKRLWSHRPHRRFHRKPRAHPANPGLLPKLHQQRSFGRRHPFGRQHSYWGTGDCGGGECWDKCRG